MADNHSIIANLYTSFEHELFGGDRLTSREFVTMMNPGQFVSPNLVEDPGSDDMQVQYDLTNRALDTSFAYRELPATIGQTYKEVLEFKALPKKTTSADEERELEGIRRWMKQHEEDYTTYRERYFDALDAYNLEARRQFPDPARLLRLARKRDDSLQDWNRRGFKRDWENRQGRLNYLLQGSPATWFDDLTTRLAANEEQAPNRGPYYKTYFVPRANQWMSPGTSWAEFTNTVNDSSSTSQSRSTAWSGGLSVGWGLWSFGASAGGSTTTQHETSQTSEVRVKFEFLRVRIARPWLMPDVFSYHFWTWKKAHGFNYLSDGGSLSATPPVRPVGQMPFIPTHFFLVRNVELSAAYSATDRQFMDSQFQSKASFGWGPFSVSGSYSERNTTQKFTGKYESGTLSIPHPQVIAFSGLLLPKTPDPIRTLPWEDDSVFPEQMRKDALEYHRAQLASDYARAHAEAIRDEQRRAAEEMLDIESVRANKLAEEKIAAVLKSGVSPLEQRFNSKA